MNANSKELFRSESRKVDGARRIVHKVFQDFPGHLSVRLWNGETIGFGNSTPDFSLVFHHPRPFGEIVLHRDPLRLADAFFRGMVDVEGDIYAALGLNGHLQSRRFSTGEKARLLATTLALRKSKPGKTQARSVRRPLIERLRERHSRALNRQAIAFHYDVSNDFYRLWLDENMVYSCAYFEEPHQTLDEAQRAKLEHICRKLRLSAGERLLDIGCGWGALIHWAARHHGAQAHGITLSSQQYEHCRRMISEQGLEGRVSVELRDYRDMEGEAIFDKIVSVGMFEHVGLKNLPLYFGTAGRLLKPGGLFLNHGITHDSEGWRKTVTTEFINRYVFPDGELDTVSNIQRAMERSSFEILDVEALRPHYALTLRHWVQRLEARRTEALRHVTEEVYRIWRLYMAACALEFENGGMGVYHILASKRGQAQSPVPLTRRDLYR